MTRGDTHNYFDLRWVDGYAAVTDAPAALAIAIEAFAAKVPSTTERATRVVGEVEVEGERRAVGVLRLDVEVPSATRVLRYLHAAAAPPGEALGDDAWRDALAHRYGRDVEARIREIYGELATLDPATGRERLCDFKVRADDLGASGELPAQRTTTTGHHARLPRTLDDSAAPPPPPLPRERARASRGLLATIAILALGLGAGGGWLARGAHGDGDDREELRAALAQARDANARLLQGLGALQQRMIKDAQQCATDAQTMVRVRDDLQARLKKALDDRDTLEKRLEESCPARKGTR